MISRLLFNSRLVLCVVFICITAYIYISPQVHAQSPLGSGDILLEVTPEFPSPNSSVVVSLNDYGVNAVGATIFWFVDGKEKTEFKNQRSIELNAGVLGKKATVRVVLVRDNAPRLETTLIISPVTIDIILEANTYVPQFYNGRALPSTKSNMRAIAIVNDGASVPDDSYTYRWTLADEVLFAGPVRGKNTVEFTMPLFTNSLSVEVFDASGKVIAKNNTQLSTTEPELHFYEQSPLRGLFQKEISDPFLLIGEETTLSGEPYFLNTTLSSKNTEFAWKVGGRPVTTQDEAINAITLRREGSSGSAQIELRVLTIDRIPQLVQKFFQTIF